jgi:FKBP-type peptidyl-prolyl cis-trans isomerase
MQPFPRWITWVFVILLAYILYTGNKAQEPPESVPEEPIATSSNESRDYDKLRRLTDGDRWYRAINPNHVGTANIKDIKAGEGEAVSCGHEVEVLLRGTDANGANFDETHDESKPLRFLVGDASIPALNEGVIGMRKGGTRQLIAPGNQAYKKVGKSGLEDVTFHLTLSDHHLADTTDMPAYAVTSRTGDDSEDGARCGEPLTAKLSIFDAAGKRIYASESPVTFTLGKRELALGVDVLARDMRIDEERLLTIPPHYLEQSKAAADALSAVRKALSGDQLRVVQITRVSSK